MTQLTPEQMHKIIKEKSNLSDLDIENKKAEMKQKYDGVLSDVGAYIMLSKQLKITLDLKTRVSQNTTIAEIQSNPDMDSVSLYARVKSIPPLRRYKTKDGSEGKIQNIFIYDGDNFIKLNLWNEQADVVEQQKLEPNDFIQIKDAYISIYNERTELSLRTGGIVILNPTHPTQTISPNPTNFINLNKVESGTELIETVGRITTLYPRKTFTSQERERSVTNFEISDGEKTLKCVAWDPWAQEISDNYSKGDIIKLTSVSVKDGLYDLELHISYYSTITKNPKHPEITIPPLSEILKDEYVLGKANDLEQDKAYRLEGSIISINRNNIAFYKCPECKSKVSLINGTEFVCESCATNVDPTVNLFSSMTLDDGNATIKLLLFGSLVEDLLEVKRDDLKKELSEDEKDKIFTKAEEKVLGKKVTAFGRATINNFSNSVEFIVSSLEME